MILRFEQPGRCSGGPGVRTRTPASNFRSESGSEPESGRSEQAVERGIGHKLPMPAVGRGRSQGQEAMGGLRHNVQRGIQMVYHHVLHRLSRVVHLEGPILIVVMGFFLPVQRRMRQVSQRIHR